MRLENPKLNGSLFPRYIAAAEDLARLVRDAGLTLVELSLAWLTANPVMSSIVCGAQHPDQIAANAKVGDITLPPDLTAAIGKILIAHGLEESRASHPWLLRRWRTSFRPWRETHKLKESVLSNK